MENIYTVHNLFVQYLHILNISLWEDIKDERLKYLTKSSVMTPLVGRLSIFGWEWIHLWLFREKTPRSRGGGGRGGVVVGHPVWVGVLSVRVGRVVVSRTHTRATGHWNKTTLKSQYLGQR